MKTITGHAAPPPRGPATASSRFDRDGIGAMRRTLFVSALVMLGAVIALSAMLRRPPTLTTYFFDGDLVWLAGIAAATALTAYLSAPGRLGHWATWNPIRAGAPIALSLGLAALVGNRLVQHGIALSYDEVMVEFDAAVFLGGRLIAPLAPEWRSSLPALATSFVLPVPGNAGWISSYLPVNAAIRAAFGLIGAPWLAGPALAAVAVLAVLHIARRLWPDRPDAAVVAALMVATAPQVVVTAMTPYAMTAHLALNLVWLCCFLRGGRLGTAGAIAVGFLACGLHQVVFHPLFALPFLVGLVTGRRWGLAALYAVAYALIGAFWTLYWQGLLAVTGLSGPGEAVGGGYMAARVMRLVADFDWLGLDVMAMNLVRFVAWQCPLLLPLAAWSWPAIRRGEDLARPLIAGVALTVVTLFVLLPYQGHGWGYRYLHGLIGSIALLAAQGWIRLTAAMDAGQRRSAAALLGLGWVATGLILVPGRAEEARRFAAPYAAAVAAIARAPVEVVLVDDARLAFGMDLVRNAPDLRNTPTVMLLRRIEPAALADLCARRTLALFGHAEGARLGIAHDRTDVRPPAIPCPVPPVAIPD